MSREPAAGAADYPSVVNLTVSSKYCFRSSLLSDRSRVPYHSLAFLNAKSFGRKLSDRHHCKVVELRQEERARLHVVAAEVSSVSPC